MNVVNVLSMFKKSLRIANKVEIFIISNVDLLQASIVSNV